MIMLLNVHLNPSKIIVVELQKIYGVGLTTAKEICNVLNINPQYKVKEITSEEEDRLNNYLSNMKVEDTLRTEKKENLARENSINSIRARRKRSGLPVKGRTRSNGNTARKLNGKIY